MKFPWASGPFLDWRLFDFAARADVHLGESERLEELGELRFGPFQRLSLNPAVAGGQHDLLDGLLSGVVFEILVETAKHRDLMFPYLRLFFVEVTVGDSTGWDDERDAFVVHLE